MVYSLMSLAETARSRSFSFCDEHELSLEVISSPLSNDLWIRFRSWRSAAACGENTVCLIRSSRVVANTRAGVLICAHGGLERSTRCQKLAMQSSLTLAGASTRCGKSSCGVGSASCVPSRGLAVVTLEVNLLRVGHNGGQTTRP